MKRYYNTNKYIINENHLLRMKYNDLVRYILYLQNELDKLYKKCHQLHNDNDNHNNNHDNQNHSNALLFLQNKNASLNKTIIEKNKHISSLMKKLDIPYEISRSPPGYNFGLDCSYNISYSESSSDNGTNE